MRLVTNRTGPLLMEYIFHGSKNPIDSSIFTYFGAISVKRIRRFDLLTTDLSHAWIVCDLTQIPAEGSGCRWRGGGQLVSLIKIHCGAVLFDVDGLLDFASVPLLFLCYVENRSGTDVKSRRPSTSNNTAPQ